MEDNSLLKLKYWIFEYAIKKNFSVVIEEYLKNGYYKKTCINEWGILFTIKNIILNNELKSYNNVIKLVDEIYARYRDHISLRIYLRLSLSLKILHIIYLMQENQPNINQYFLTYFSEHEWIQQKLEYPTAFISAFTYTYNIFLSLLNDKQKIRSFLCEQVPILFGDKFRDKQKKLILLFCDKIEDALGPTFIEYIFTENGRKIVKDLEIFVFQNILNSFPSLDSLTEDKLFILLQRINNYHKLRKCTSEEDKYDSMELEPLSPNKSFSTKNYYTDKSQSTFIPNNNKINKFEPIADIDTKSQNCDTSQLRNFTKNEVRANIKHISSKDDNIEFNIQEIQELNVNSNSTVNFIMSNQINLPIEHSNESIFVIDSQKTNLDGVVSPFSKYTEKLKENDKEIDLLIPSCYSIYSQDNNGNLNDMVNISSNNISINREKSDISHAVFQELSRDSNKISPEKSYANHNALFHSPIHLASQCTNNVTNDLIFKRYAANMYRMMDNHEELEPSLPSIISFTQNSNLYILTQPTSLKILCNQEIEKSKNIKSENSNSCKLFVNYNEMEPNISSYNISNLFNQPSSLKVLSDQAIAKCNDTNTEIYNFKNGICENYLMNSNSIVNLISQNSNDMKYKSNSNTLPKNIFNQNLTNYNLIYDNISNEHMLYNTISKNEDDMSLILPSFDIKKEPNFENINNTNSHCNENLKVDTISNFKVEKYDFNNDENCYSNVNPIKQDSYIQNVIIENNNSNMGTKITVNMANNIITNCTKLPLIEHPYSLQFTSNAKPFEKELIDSQYIKIENNNLLQKVDFIANKTSIFDQVNNLISKDVSIEPTIESKVSNNFETKNMLGIIEAIVSNGNKIRMLSSESDPAQYFDAQQDNDTSFQSCLPNSDIANIEDLLLEISEDEYVVDDTTSNSEGDQDNERHYFLNMKYTERIESDFQ